MAQNLSIKDLEMFPTDSLLEEVMRRCSPAIFLGTKYEADRRDGTWVNFSRWTGNVDTCRGMCHEMDSLLLRHLLRDENERENSEEDQ